MSVADDAMSAPQSTDGTPAPVEVPSPEALRDLDEFVARMALSFATATSSRVELLITEWLERLTHFLSVDLVTLYEFSAPDGALHSDYHFRNHGIDPPPTALTMAEIPAVLAALERGEVLRYERPCDVPLVDRAGIAAFRFPSVLGAPFAIDGALGYLVFSALRAERRFHDSVVLRLRTSAEILAHGVVRQRAVQRRDVLEPKPGAPGFPELLLSIVSHDLRNPLSAVSGLAQLLRSKDGLAPDVARRVAAIDEAARRMNDMIATLIDFGETQLHGGLRLTRTSTDLQDICQQAISAQPQTTLSIVFEESNSVRGAWDSARLGQLVRDLLAYALTRAENQPIFLSLKQVGASAVLSVRDSGAVIPELILRQIFEPLAPVPTGQGPWVQGVALRLHIGQQIAQSHGGTLSVESSREAGTHFTVRLPIMRIANGY
jgi:signal transduction histidine kinase